MGVFLDCWEVQNHIYLNYIEHNLLVKLNYHQHDEDVLQQLVFVQLFLQFTSAIRLVIDGERPIWWRLGEFKVRTLTDVPSENPEDEVTLTHLYIYFYHLNQYLDEDLD